MNEKNKALHQDYRNAVPPQARKVQAEGFSQENFELLAESWGGSPARTSLPFGVSLDPAREGAPTMFELCM